MTPPCCDRMPILEFVSAVAQKWGITYRELCGDDYRAHASLPRHVAMFLLRENTLIRTDAARACGRSDAMTVHHAEGKITKLLSDPANVLLQAQIATLRAQVAARGGICICGKVQAPPPGRRSRKGYKPRCEATVEIPMSAGEVDRVLSEGEAREIAMPWERKVKP